MYAPAGKLINTRSVEAIAVDFISSRLSVTYMHYAIQYYCFVKRVRTYKDVKLLVESYLFARTSTNEYRVQSEQQVLVGPGVPLVLIT